MIEPTVERQAFNALLARYPAFDVLNVDWMIDRDRGGTWLLVELGQPSEGLGDVWARHRFAIFRRTGAIHGLQIDGSVTDDALPI